MIEHINERLMRWADWAANGHRAHGLWYSPCTLRNLMVHRSPTVQIDVDYDEEASETDKAVTALPSELKAVVVVYYLKPGPNSLKAKEMHCCVATLFNRLHDAQRCLDEHLTARVSETA